MKPNNKLSYIHRQSNHPPALLKNVPLNINKRLTNISSSKEVFDESIAPYQHALKESGYDHRLTYNPGPTPKNKRKRKRDILWYNLPFDSSVKTNLGRKFLHIVEKCFLNNHPLYKIFNRHTQAKLLMYAKHEIHHIVTQQTRSFRCNTPAPQPDTCNRRKNPECPLEGKCLQTNVIYQAGLERHLSLEACSHATERKTLLDMSKEEYTRRLEEGSGAIPTLPCDDALSSSIDILPKVKG